MYLVTGATGQLGRSIVRQLREQGHSVRVMVRLSSDYQGLAQRGAEIFLGDLRSRDDLERACRGVKVVISAHGGRGPDGAFQLDYRANAQLIEISQAQEVQHFTYISVLGADRDYPDAPTFKAKAAVEQRLASSHLNYTILRPSGFASNLLGPAAQFQQFGLYPLIGEATGRTSIVSTDDVALLAIRSAQIPAAQRQIFAVGGPEALVRSEIPQIFGRIFEREPWVVPIPLAVVDAGRFVFGLVDQETYRTLGTFRTLLAHDFACTPGEIQRLREVFGLPLESLEHYLRRHFDR